MQPESVGQLVELVQSSTALTVHSRRTDTGTVVDLSGFNRVLDYPVADMTITVESGITVAAMQAALAKHSQHLPIDVADPQHTTIGDAVAWDLSGSRRFGYGTFRDYVIGITAVDGRGRVFKSGGRVVKNVAGYDLCKLMIGSHGTLGIITKLTFKVLPQPAMIAGVGYEFDSLSAIEPVLEAMTTSSTRPIAKDVFSSGGRHVLMLLFDGSEAEVRWQLSELEREVTGGTRRPIEEREVLAVLQNCELGEPGANRFVAGLQPSAVIQFLQQAGCSKSLARAGNGIVVGITDSMHAVRSMAEGLGGWCRSNTSEGQSFSYMDGLSGKVKAVFDPDGRFG